MLQSMRDKMQGLIAGGIAVIIALTFALWGIQNYLQGGRDSAVAKIDGAEISQRDLQTAYEQAKRSQMYSLGKKGYLFDQKAQAELKRNVLQNLVKQHVLFQAGEEMGLAVTKKQLLGIAAGMSIFQVNGVFSPDRFQRFVQALFGSEQAFFAEIEKSFLQMQLERGVVSSAFLLPNETAYIKTISKQRRDFGYFMIFPNSFVSGVTVSGEEIQKYYDESQKEFLLPENVSISYVELISDKLSSEVKPSKEQLKDFYKSHIASFSTPKKWQVKRILLPLSDNAKPEDVNKAKEKLNAYVGQDKGKKDSAAKLSSGMKVTTSWLKRADMLSSVFAQVNKLQAGKTSVPFRTKEGYNLVKVLAIQPENVKPYKEVAKKVKELYEHQLKAKAFSEANDKLADLVYTNPDSLDLAATNLGLKVKDSKLFASDFIDKDGVLANLKVVKAAFSDVVLQQRYNSNLIEIDPGHVVVLRIKEYVPEKLQTLSKVKSIIKKKLKDKKAKEEAEAFADKLLQSLSAGESVAKLSEQYKLKWHVVSKAKYGQRGKDAKLVEEAFDLAKPDSKKISATKIKLNGDYVVLVLNKVYSARSSKEDATEKSILRSLPFRMGRFDYQTLVNSFMDNAKIEIVEKSLER